MLPACSLWIAFTAASDQGVASSTGLTPEPVAADTGASLPWRLDRVVASLGAGAAGLLAPRTAHAHGIPWDVWVIRPDGTGLRQVTSFADDDSSVAWSPDGRWLVTLSAEALHVVALDGGENYCIGNEGGYGALEWLP